MCYVGGGGDVSCRWQNAVSADMHLYIHPIILTSVLSILDFSWEGGREGGREGRREGGREGDQLEKMGRLVKHDTRNHKIMIETGTST